MAEKFIKYRSFNDKVLATDLCQRLSENNIPFQWESTEGFFDASFTHNDILDIYYVKLKATDFEKADQLLMHAVVTNDEEPSNDYYLFSFSDEELTDVLKKPDEWNEFDLYWAKKILKTRGVEVKQEEIDFAKKERLAELKKPWIVDKVWIICAFALLIAAIWLIHIYFAIALIFLGGYISFSKKTMPDGERVNAFSADDRLLGKIVLIIGLATGLFILLQYFGVIDFIYPF